MSRYLRVVGFLVMFVIFTAALFIVISGIPFEMLKCKDLTLRQAWWMWGLSLLVSILTGPLVFGLADKAFPCGGECCKEGRDAK